MQTHLTVAIFRNVVGARIALPPIFRVLSKLFIQLRVQGRNPARFNGGDGVLRGFRGRNPGKLA